MISPNSRPASLTSTSAGWGAFSLLLTATPLALRGEGRSWWCACGQGYAWVSDIWSDHCSQHLLDAYSFSHLLHGLIFYFAAQWLMPKMRFVWQFWIATFLECAWEILENSPFIIQRYRAVTISLGYEGDSVINSLADVACFMLGFRLAKYLGFSRSLLVFAVTEIVSLATIRDNLTLNVLMLVWPVEAIKAWQMVH
ncbi:MAG: hypothetical protein JWO08_2038 [Verrucomicrobiaceae bacterium]|nr:hypothetical protein [Verrucomicrobiaceae bacterium]